MKNNLFKIVAAGTMALSMLAGCSSGSGSSSNGGSEGGKTGDTVKIGLNFELSGAVADYGKSEDEGAKLAIKQFNEREDKPFTVEAVEADTKSDVAEATSTAQKLVDQDGVAAIVGPATSGSSIATYAVADSAKVPVLSPSATQVDAMMNNGTPYEYAWRVCFEDSYQGKAMAIYSYDNLKAKNAVVINEVSDYGQGLAKAYKEEFEKLGGKVVKELNYNSGDKDFASYVTQIKKLDFDVIYIAGYYTEAGLIIKQAREDGIDCPIVGADGFDSTVLVETAGKENSSDLYFTTAFTTVDPSEEMTAFLDSYKEEYGKDANMFAALAYDATNLVLDELEATGATGEELNEAIKKADFTGITGSFKFDESNHTPIKDVLVVSMKDGEQQGAESVKVD